MPESNRLRQKRQKAESSRNRESTGCGPDTLPHRLKRFNSLEGTESQKTASIDKDTGLRHYENGSVGQRASAESSRSIALFQGLLTKEAPVDGSPFREQPSIGVTSLMKWHPELMPLAMEAVAQTDHG